MLVRIDGKTERCMIKRYGRPGDYPEPMVWCKVFGDDHTFTRKLVIPARVLTGAILFRSVSYEVVS